MPGPQFPLYAAGAEMIETYPVPPLLPGHALAIGVTSYDGGVYYGITADRDALPDVDVLGQCIREALDELVDVRAQRPAARRRGRRRVVTRRSRRRDRADCRVTRRRGCCAGEAAGARRLPSDGDDRVRRPC